MPVSNPIMVGDSPRSRQVLRLIEKLGSSRWPVLILGETGTGKEVAARTIYNTNPEGPFVPIDCSSLVGPLMESELFGHAKGSFTGAVVNKIGLIEAANGGTAFFDEIGELPLDMQVKLLRVLQEKEFRPVGSLTQKKSDFRMIAATNRDLAKEVEKGTFRRDLYYRLNVVTVRLAPLRERKEDIPALLQHFLERYGLHHVISDEVMEALAEYEWPGNVRELENCVQHMVAVNSGPALNVVDLPSSFANHRWAQSLPMPQTTTVRIPLNTDRTRLDAEPPPMVTPLAELEKRAILDALRHTKGDRTVAAALLGIGRTTLYRKLKEYEMVDQEIE